MPVRYCRLKRKQTEIFGKDIQVNKDIANLYNTSNITTGLVLCHAESDIGYTTRNDDFRKSLYMRSRDLDVLSVVSYGDQHQSKMPSCQQELPKA